MGSGVASRGMHRRVGIQAERTQASRRIRKADHRKRTGFVLPIKGGGIGGVETTWHRVVGIIEPEPHVEGVGGRKWRRRASIEAENLIHENTTDRGERRATW